MANAEANSLFGNNDVVMNEDADCSESTRCWKTLRKLMQDGVFNCESCGQFYKTAVFSVYGKGTVCEGCVTNNDWQGERLKFFDAALQDLPVVSCSYADSGCRLQTLPEDLDAHLEHCKYRPVDCMLPGCSWQSKQDDLVEHFKAVHQTDVIAEETVFDLDISQDMFVVAKLLIKNAEKYFLVIKRELNSNRVLYNAFKVLQGNVHDIYIRHFCDSTEDYRKHIETEDLNTIDKTCTLNKISLVVLNELSEGKNKLSVTVKVEKSKIEQMLACTSCGETMQSPIYQCKKKHNVCDACLLKSFQCRVCQNTLDGKSRNVSLEAWTSKVYYSCANQAFGCQARISGVEIDRHEAICPVVHPCPLPNCSYKTRSLTSMKLHAGLPHKNVLQGNKHEFILDLNYDQKETIHVSYDGSFFEINFFSLKCPYPAFPLGNDDRMGRYSINTTVKLLSANVKYGCDMKLCNVRKSGEEIFKKNVLLKKGHETESVLLPEVTINHGKLDARFNVCLYVEFKKRKIRVPALS